MTIEAKIKEFQNEHKTNPKTQQDEDTCPLCGADLVHEYSCVMCYNCGWSACG